MVICITGIDLVSNMGGRYWVIWNFTWENVSFAFKPNYMPKKYAMYILPLMGSMISVSALAAIIEDVIYIKGKFKITTLESE